MTLGLTSQVTIADTIIAGVPSVLRIDNSTILTPTQYCIMQLSPHADIIHQNLMNVGNTSNFAGKTNFSFFNNADVEP